MQAFFEKTTRVSANISICGLRSYQYAAHEAAAKMDNYRLISRFDIASPTQLLLHTILCKHETGKHNILHRDPVLYLPGADERISEDVVI